MYFYFICIIDGFRFIVAVKMEKLVNRNEFVYAYADFCHMKD